MILSVQGPDPTPYLRISEINVKAKRTRFCRPRRRNARGFEIYLALEDRGRGEDRVRAAPAVSQAIVHQKMRPRAYRFSGEHPAFPAQWPYGLYEFALVTGFLATIIGRDFRLDTT
jgi:hypothetical protein